MTDEFPEKELPQLYLITPPAFDLSTFSDQMQRVLDVAPVACMRLALATKDETQIGKSGDMLREICHARDIPLVIETHLIMVERLGLDGVHLTDGARSVRYARKELGDDAIIGAYCAASRHDGLTAGESSAEYVSFGPVGQSALGDGSIAPTDLFEWWSNVVEVPVVAEGALTVEGIKTLSPFTDFFAIGAEIWDTDDPAGAFKSLAGAIQ